MRFHFRRLLPLALSSTFVTLILLYSLRPSQDDDPAAQPRYKEPQNQKTNGESLKDELMSENIAGSLNEQIRREFVHLPSLEHADSGGVETALWWSSSTDHPTDRILAQMRHVPKNYHGRDQQTPLKTIYTTPLSSSRRNRPARSGQCSYWNLRLILACFVMLEISLTGQQRTVQTRPLLLRTRNSCLTIKTS